MKNANKASFEKEVTNKLKIPTFEDPIDLRIPISLVLLIVSYADKPNNPIAAIRIERMEKIENAFPVRFSAANNLSNDSSRNL